MKRRFTVYVVLLIVYMGIIFWVSSLPGEQLTPESALGIIISASVKHVSAYAILGILMSVVIAQVSNKTLSIIFYSSTFSSCYGIFDEIHQYFVPTRYCTLLDMYINIIGSITGVLFYLVLSRYTRWVSDESYVVTNESIQTYEACCSTLAGHIGPEFLIANERLPWKDQRKQAAGSSDHRFLKVYSNAHRSER